MDAPDDIFATAFATLMMDLPEEIFASAFATLSIIQMDHVGKFERWDGDASLKLIAEALMAEREAAVAKERERCASIARMWLADWEGLPIDNVPAGKYAADAVKDILDAIRRGAI